MEETACPNTTMSTSSEDFYDRGKSTFLVIFFTFVMIVGVSGNCLVLRVYCGKAHKSSTHALIIGLAVVDLVVCLLRPYEIAWYSSFLAEAGIPKLFFDIFNCLDRPCIATSIILTGVIALDRYDCVCRHNRRVMTYGRAKKSRLAAFVASMIGNIPLFLQAGMQAEAPKCLDTIMFSVLFLVFLTSIITISVCYGKVFLTIRGHVRIAAEKQELKCQNSTTAQVSVVIETVSTIDTMQAGLCNHSPSSTDLGLVRQQKHCTSACERLSTSESKNSPCTSTAPRGFGPTTSSQLPRVRNRPRKAPAPALQRRTTLMLFITSVVFLLSWLPYGINAAVDILGQKSSFLKFFLNILYLNNAINPFIYSVANIRFRKDCRETIRKMRQC